MEKYKLSRKERRKAEQNKLAAEQLKKGTTVLSSAIVVSSIAAPIAAPKIAEATEEQTPNAQISYSETPTHTGDVQSQTTTDPNDSMTEDTQETSSSEETTETTDSSELNTSETTQGTEETTTETTEDLTETTDSSTDEADALPEVSLRSFAATTRSISPSAFIAEISGHARSVASANDLYASVMMAQAILESDWGRSTLSAAPNHNLFGIKGSYQGQSVTMQTWEVYNGQWVQVNAAFRKYPSYSESFSDNAYVLKNTSFQSGVYYYSGAWKSNTNSYRDATAWLTGRYATDPSYNTKLNNIITTYNLTQYDTPATGGNTGGNNNNGNTGGNTGGSSGNTGNTGNTSSQNVTHTVKSGDSLWALAAQYGTSVANIKSWNGLSSDMIYVGQKLIVKKGSGSTSGGNTGGNSGSTGNTGNSGNTSTSNTYYTVKSGDSLWAIANANGTSVANIRQWNNLSGDMIYPGQKLIVKKGSGNTNSGNSGSTGNTGNSNNSGNTGTSNSTYTVKSGDSLWAIANSNGVSIANLRQWNNLSGDIIYPGQKLIVKKGSGSASSNNNSSSNTGSSSTNSGSTTGSYTVKSGDSLWAIASANGTSVANLRQWNNLSGDMIYPGQKLIVKKGGSSTSSSSSSSNQGNTQSAGAHKVKSGDTLWGLAQKYNTSVQKIKQLNGLSSDVIYIGQQLKVK
ncbi:LysM peptidoglycan-binding domain-containing protein [Enterococcus sp. DIV0242_7C1]|uniref:Peptidoglycan hydrolase n=1 Tax=Candidatus Enterococcus dunnyi TaxID=1834192 RepID=A0A200ITS7_9ENTE|nr:MULTISPECIES: LysM peptidoglycan-binding domain-containing protein [unclassified Enterococcus]MBO0471282.1 LysM peptidoglycan-binding domain-containing protein [Enterococcus sp. DIV0242_7C1]OUZ28328.1 hypothetical protein A5889_003083 [Enterococcus sp. 9D6_DIV0238]